MLNEIAAIEAVMKDDEPGAQRVMAGMTGEELHEFMRVCLITSSLARESIVGPAGLPDGDSKVREAHRIVEAMAPE